MTEFALAIPLFLFLALGVVEFGWLLFVYSQTYTASREAARYGVAVENLGDCAGIVDAAVRVGHMGGVVDATNVEIVYDQSSATGADLDFWNTPTGLEDYIAAHPDRHCESGQTQLSNDTIDSISLGDRIIVRVSVDFVPIFGIVPESTIVNTSLRTVIKGVEVYNVSPANP